VGLAQVSSQPFLWAGDRGATFASEKGAPLWPSIGYFEAFGQSTASELVGLPSSVVAKPTEHHFSERKN
jgi:hypothetical protein